MANTKMKYEIYYIFILPSREVKRVKIPKSKVKKYGYGPLDQAFGRDWEMLRSPLETITL